MAREHEAPEYIPNDYEAPQYISPYQGNPRQWKRNLTNENLDIFNQRARTHDGYNGRRDEKPTENQRRIFGLGASWFWTLFVLIGLIIVGGSVGGAVGGTIAIKNSSTPSSSNATSATSASAASTASASLAPLITTCDDKTLYTPLDSTGAPGTSTFQRRCGNAIGDDVVLAEAYVQSLDLCIDMFELQFGCRKQHMYRGFFLVKWPNPWQLLDS